MLLHPEDVAAPDHGNRSTSHAESTASERVRRSQEEWLRVRGAAGARGRELSESAAWLYPAEWRALGGHVPAGPGWLLDEPVESDSVLLEFSDAAHPTPKSEPVDHVLPLTARGERYAVATNDEGRVVGANGRSDMPFTSEAIDRLEPRLSSSSLTLLRLAWRDRRLLLG
jgi:hypothetical protein